MDANNNLAARPPGPPRIFPLLALLTCAGLNLATAEENRDEPKDITPQSYEQKTSGYPLKPVPFNEVTLTDSFWLPRLHTQRTVLVPHAIEQTKPGFRHLQAAADFLAGKGAGDHKPHPFIDSDLYKVIEGGAYLLDVERDPKLEDTMDRIIDVIAGAQKEDGYLYPSHIIGVGAAGPGMGNAPYQYVVHSHELYNMGHLYEAAVAYHQATGKDKLLRVAERSARHINRVFFQGDPDYNNGEPVNQAPGHPEIELALVKLSHATGNPLYLEMAERFLNIRGRTYQPDGEGLLSPTFAQQQLPVEEQTEAVGHAVRAAYLYAGMADVGVLTGKKEYVEALEAIWRNITETRMHITGGLGALRGIEGFGPEYVLPNAEAYNETCAAVGNVFLNYRMFLLHEDAKYLDVAEAALFNNVLAGVNLAGDRFFYVNPLEADGESAFNQGATGRVEWFGTACCPTNLARLIPQISGMTYAFRDNIVYFTFYVGSDTTIELADGPVKVKQETRYPEEGTIRISLEPKEPQRFDLRLRIPTWTGDRFVPGGLYRYRDSSGSSWTINVNGEQVDAAVKKGFAVIDRIWEPGDEVELNLPMPVRLNTSDERVEANRDRIAVTRGPLVLCAEEVDNGPVQHLVLEDAPPAKAVQVERTSITDRHTAVRVILPGTAVEENGVKPADLTLIPYYAWNNRGDGSMIIWLPRKVEMAKRVEQND